MKTIEISDELYARLVKLASERCATDDPEFMADDYAGGNIDDAFSCGRDCGQVELARELIE